MTWNRTVLRPSVPTFEQLESRQMMSATPVASTIRSVDGTGNNLANPAWGAVGQALLRLAPAAYSDGLSAPAGTSRPSARVISNTLSTHGDADIPNSKNLSAFAYLWGQFIDHDLDLTNTGTDAVNIAVPSGDPYFDPNSTGTQTIGFTRSLAVAGTGATSARQQANFITAYIDGSMVYGSDPVRAAALRTFTGGQLKTSANGMLPYNTASLDNATAGGPASAYYLAGDVRANENIELTGMQTLFVREHNRLASQISKQNPKMTDEQVYQKARAIVIGEIQSITYNEFLPALLGASAIRPYQGYNAKVNPGISTEFSTAAFRLGHSMLENDVEFLDNNGNDVHDDVPLANAFFNPALIGQTGIDSILKYLASSNSEEVDTKVVDGLRNFLFGPPGAGGFDLASLNIQRGRDHGLSDYNTTRAKLGLPKLTSFAQITSDAQVQKALQKLYGTVDNIDLWVGGLAEDHVQGSLLGPTFQRIVSDQFTRTRDGDRFWYQRDPMLTAQDRQMIDHTTLSDIIKRNSTTTNIQDNVFVFNVEVTGRLFDDRNLDGRPQPVEQGLAGRTVKLLDANNAVIQTVTTDRNGVYHFSNVGLGTFHVAADLRTGWKSTSPVDQIVTATKGGHTDHVDFGQTLITQLADPTRPPGGGRHLRHA
jgi:peroxidase